MMETRQRAWVGVASHEHVALGCEGGFAQFCHGKAGPANRPRRGDVVIYYSPQERLGEASPCQQFTAVGEVLDEGAVQIEQAPGFLPWRRRVRWYSAQPAAIRPLIPTLAFLGRYPSWGYAFRFGFLEIPWNDAVTIAAAMGVGPDDLPGFSLYSPNASATP